MAPSLSVVVPSHKRVDLLRHCLAGVVRHAPAGAEVIVVDDASPGAAVARAAADFAAVRCLRLPRRGGFCAAANAGVRLARASVVELLNDDTEVEAGWADAALAHFADPAVAAVAPLVLCGPPPSPSPLPPDGGEGRVRGRPGPPRVDSAGDRYYLGGVAGKRGHGLPLAPEHLRPGPVFGASASGAFYRRDALLHVGAFPESFGAYFEDVDLSFRLHRAGYRVVYEPASRLWHRGAASHGRGGWRLLAQQSRNEERVFWRNLPLSAVPRHLAVLAAKAWRRLRRGGLLPFLWGRLAVLGEWPELLRHRRHWQRTGASHDPAAWGVEASFWG